jgi:hypothetical protein
LAANATVAVPVAASAVADVAVATAVVLLEVQVNQSKVGHHAAETDEVVLIK